MVICLVCDSEPHDRYGKKEKGGSHASWEEVDLNANNGVLLGCCLYIPAIIISVRGVCLGAFMWYTKVAQIYNQLCSW